MMVTFVVAVILFFSYIELWNKSLLKDTIFWFFGVAFVLFFKINKAHDTSFFKEIITDSVKWLIVLEFLVNFYTFSFLTELILVPVVTLIALIQAYSEIKTKYVEANKLATKLLSGIGLFIFCFVLYKTIFHSKDLGSLANLLSFALPVILTVFLIPFLYLLALYIKYEELFVRVNYMTRDTGYNKTVKREIFLEAKLDLNRLNLISKNINGFDVQHSTNIQALIRIISRGMGNISLLLGAGFSANKGYPVAGKLNKKITDLKEDEFCISSAGVVCFLTEKEEDQWTMGEYKINKLFLLDLIKFYKDSVGEFDYEKFFDYFYSLKKGEIKDANFEKFTDEFRKKYNSTTDNVQLLFKHQLMFNQIVASFIVDEEGNRFYKPIHTGKPSYPGYTGFLYCMEEWGKQNIVHVHSLNHDLFFETLSHTEWLQGRLSDGFEEMGSAYYGKLDEIYMVRLPCFSNVFDTTFRLYKLHGSVDQYPFNTQSGIVDYIKIKYKIGKTEHYKEVKDKDGKLTYVNDWLNYHSDFLTGTTSKILRYKEPLYYEKLFKHFEKNLSASEKLVIIGYGCMDEEINTIIEKFYGINTKKPIYMVNPFPNDVVKNFCQKFNAKLIEKNPEKITLEDFE